MSTFSLSLSLSLYHIYIYISNCLKSIHPITLSCFVRFCIFMNTVVLVCTMVTPYNSHNLYNVVYNPTVCYICTGQQSLVASIFALYTEKGYLALSNPLYLSLIA